MSQEQAMHDEIEDLRESLKSSEAEVSRLKAELDRMSTLASILLSDLPQKRDWLDPAIEREFRASIDAARQAEKAKQ